MTVLARLWRWLWSPFEWTAWNIVQTTDEQARDGTDAAGRAESARRRNEDQANDGAERND